MEYIYPVSLRNRDVAKLNAHRSNQGANPDSDESVPLLKAGTVHSRLGVVVDTLPQMQFLVRALQYFAPRQADSSLAVTAMHFIEPTSTIRDEFLGLNEEGRLIRIDEEPTDIAMALHDAHDPSAKKPELLPLSVYCHGIHAAINAFRVQGDPDEFPGVMKNLLRRNDCSLAVVPWRANSMYLQKFFWSTVHVSQVPIMMVVSVDDGHNHRRLRGNSATSEDENSEAAERRRGNTRGTSLVRGRGNSLFMDDYHAVELGASLTTPVHSPSINSIRHQLYSNFPENTHPLQRRASVSNIIHKMEAKGLAPSIVVALLTGRATDLQILSLLLRIAENPLNEITLLVPKDHESFSETWCEALADYQKKTLSLEGVRTLHLNIISTDLDGLVAEVAANYSYDLLLISFVAPSAQDRINVAIANAAVHVTPSDSTTRVRSATLGGFLQDTLFRQNTAGTTGDNGEEKENSGLTYRELGVLGNKLFEVSPKGKGALMFVMHDSDRTKAYHRSSFQTEESSIAAYVEEVGVEMTGGKKADEVEKADENV